MPESKSGALPTWLQPYVRPELVLGPNVCFVQYRIPRILYLKQIPLFLCVYASLGRLYRKGGSFSAGVPRFTNLLLQVCAAVLVSVYDVLHYIYL